MNIENLKKARESTGLTQAQAAEELGISGGTYTNYEQGKREPNNTLLVKIADLFGVTTDYLLGREPEENPFLGLKPIDDDEFIRLYSALPEPVKEVFVNVMGQLSQALKNPKKSKPKNNRASNTTEKADGEEPVLFIAASDGNPITEIDKGVIERLRNAPEIDPDEFDNL